MTDLSQASISRLGPFALLASLLLTSPTQAGDVVGTVTAPDGSPVAGVPVEIGDLFVGTATGPDGSFTIPDVPAGEYRVDIAPRFLQMLGRTSRLVSVPEEGRVDLAVRLEANAAARAAAADYSPPAEPHLAQKASFLASIATASADAPNVIVILFDDLGYGDLSSYGNRLLDTPNIDRWGARGMRLDAFYASSPVCTPSRAGLLTGRYPSRSLSANHVFFPDGHPVTTVRHAMGLANALPRDEILLPEMLRAAGYATGIFGKWHLGDAEGHQPQDFGFDRWFGVLHSNDMQPLHMFSDGRIETSAEDVAQETLTQRFTDEALRFISDNRNRPFFAYIPYTAPHLPHVPTDDRRGTSDGGIYGDVIEDLDHHVGRIAAALQEMGLAENTLVIITSDNGGDWGGSAGALRGRKGDTWEGGQRVPFFAIWPGHIAPGSTSDAMAMNIDILPTLAELAGVDLPGDRVIDGQGLGPLLWGDGSSQHEYLYYLTYASGEFHAVRDAEFKYRPVLAQQSFFAPTGDLEFYMASNALYDMGRDNEAHDVTARHPERAATLAAQLAAWREAHEANPRGWMD